MARYRRIRNDFYVHQRTVGLTPVARCLFMLAVLENAHGVIERSIKRMASAIGASLSGVEAGLAELQTRQLATWWEEYEVLWIHETADEQCMNDGMWASISSDLKRFPIAVLVAFSKRYPDTITVPDTVSPTVSPHSPTHAIGHPPVSVSDPVPVKGDGYGDTRADGIAECAERVKTLIRDYRRLCGIDAQTRPVGKQQIKIVQSALRAGFSEEDMELAAWRQYQSTRRDRPAAEKWLTMSTVLRPSNLARLLERDDLGHPQASAPTKPKLVQIGTDWWWVHPDGHKEPAEPPEDA